jgi:hypothetical protein
MLELKAPEWTKAVNDARTEHTDYLTMSLDAFAGDPQLVFVALWYAYSYGVAVLVTPAPSTQVGR